LTSGVVITAFQRAALSGRPVTFAPTGRADVCASSIAMVILALPVPVNSGR
jgi:hypothetical protein